MKHIALALIVGGLAAAGVQAQTKPDPFDKKTAPRPAPPAMKPQDIDTLLMMFETYSLPLEELDGLLGEGLAGTVLQERILALAKAGKATLDNVVALPTKSSQRASNESFDAVLHGVEFGQVTQGRDYAIPTRFDMQPAGERVEIDPTLSADQQVVDLNLELSSSRLASFTESKAEPSVQGQMWPLFAKRSIQSAYTVRMGQPLFMGTLSGPANTGFAEADTAGRPSVAFVTVRASSRKAREPAPEAKTELPAMWHAVVRYYSLDRAEARKLLAGSAEADVLHGQMKAVAKLERLIALNGKSGQRVATREAAEHMFGAEVEIPAAPPPASKTPAEAKPKDAVAAPGPPHPVDFTAVEMKSLGWSVEMDPTMQEDGLHVDLNVALECNRFMGMLQGPALLARYPQQPVFAQQKIQTAVVAQVGHQTLLGTMNPPGDTGVNGRKDEGKVWLVFVEMRKD